MKRKLFRRVLGTEDLEARQLMAGDVATAVSGQTLTLTGDALDNGVVITGLAGQVQVTGFEQDGADTTVNGNHRATFTNIRKIVVDLGTGDDALVVTNLTLTGTAVGLAPVGTGPTVTGTTATNRVPVSLAIQMGDGDDIVGLGEFDNLTDEIDPLTLLPIPLVDETVDSLLGSLSVSRDMVVDLGDGENILRATAVSVGRSLSIAAGIDDDSLRLESRGTFGDEDFRSGISVGLDTNIASGDGNDEIEVDRLLTRNFNLSSGDGNDTIDLTNVTVTLNTAIAGSDGFDEIRLDTFSSRRLNILAGNGDDDVFVKNVSTTSTATIDGGAGDDIYHSLGGNNFRSLRLLNFETVLGTTATAKIISRAPRYT